MDRRGNQKNINLNGSTRQTKTINPNEPTWQTKQTYYIYLKKSKVELAYHVIINIEKEKNIYENEKYFAQ